MGKMMIVARANALAHRIVAATTLFGTCDTAPVERCQQRFRRRPRVAVHRMLDGHLIAELGHIDIDLCDDRTGGDQLALLSSPLRKTCTEAENKIALRDQFIGDWRGKAAADADRPGALRK